MEGRKGGRKGSPVQYFWVALFQLLFLGELTFLGEKIFFGENNFFTANFFGGMNYFFEGINFFGAQ